MLQQRKTVARLTTPAQMAASVPLWLGFVPTESLVVMCCHEPRGRIGLTMRIDLPPVDQERAFVEQVLARIRHEKATRVVLAIYTDEPDRATRARSAMAAALRRNLADLVVTELLLVRDGRFWSFLCDDPRCCPLEGTPVDAAAQESPLLLLQAEQALEGKTLLPDRTALEQSLQGPQGPAALAALARCQRELHDPHPAPRELWRQIAERFDQPPAVLSELEAAQLAVSLIDRNLRDELGMTPDPNNLLPLAEELCRRTPKPYDAAVCTLFAWLAYQAGGGAVVSIALERALATDPAYRLAQLLQEAVLAQVAPRRLRA